jgi:hypothetical protein
MAIHKRVRKRRIFPSDEPVRLGGSDIWAGCGCGWLWRRYWLWPSGVADTPLVQLTLGQAFKVVGCGVLGLIGIAGVASAIKDGNEPF